MQRSKVRIIDLREYFRYLLEKALPVLIIAVVFALLMGGYSYLKQGSAQASAASLNVIRTNNHDAYYFDTTEYTDAELPDGAYISYAQIYLDFDFSTVENSESADFSTLVSTASKDMLFLITNYDMLEEVIEELDLRSYADMEDITADDLRWMINRNYFGLHTLNVNVTDTDPERAKLILECILDHFMEEIDTAGFDVDEAYILAEPTDAIGEEAAAATISNKKILKYAIVGFAGGFILAAVFLLILFLVRPKVRSQLDLEYADFPLFGRIEKKADRREKIGCMAYALELRGCSHVVLIDMDGGYDVSEMAAQMNETLNSSETTVTAALPMIRSADALQKMRDADALLFTASYGKTLLSDAVDTGLLLKDVEIKNLGVIIIES